MSSCKNPSVPEDVDEDSSKNELREMEEGFHEAMKSIEMIKVLRQLQASLEGNILELLEGKDDFGDTEEEGAAGGHRETLSKLEMEKLQNSKDEASKRYEDYKKTLAEGAKESFKCKEFEEQLARMIQDMQEFDATLNLLSDEETISKNN